MSARFLSSFGDWLRARGPRFWALVIAGLGLLIYLPRLGAFPLWDPWEPQYVQVAWEMQRRRTWLDPFYQNVANWWSKPIFMLWMLRAGLGAFWDAAGHFADPEYPARLPFALTAVVGALLLFDWVRRLFGLRIGVLAAFVLLTTPQYVLVGRQVMPDGPLAVFFTSSMGYLAVSLFAAKPLAAPSDAPLSAHMRSAARRNWPIALFWFFSALAILTKGFVQPVLATLVLGGYYAATFRWQDYASAPAGRMWNRSLLLRLAGMLAMCAAAAALMHVLPVRNADERLVLQALIGLGSALTIGLGIFVTSPPMQHLRHLLVRIRVAWGLPLLLLVAGPWFVFMTVRHGWPYWQELIFYHHLGRAAGTIDKPIGTFEFFVRQLGMGVFPWSALAFGALWRVASRSSAFRSIAERRNLFVLLCFLLPCLFFSLSVSKFAHYILPAVPMLCVMVAAALDWLGREPAERAHLAEIQPSLGPAVPAYAGSESPWWERPGARGDLVVFAALALICLGVLSHDLAMDFRLMVRTVVYYTSRLTPLDYQPYILLQILFLPAGVVMGLWLFSAYIRTWHRWALVLAATILACYWGWVMMPSMDDTYSYKTIFAAYTERAAPGDSVGQYIDWAQPERSALFLSRNRLVHLRNDRAAESFLGLPARKFVIVSKDHIATLRRPAQARGITLYKILERPGGCLLSSEPDPGTNAADAGPVISALPADLTATDIDFGGKIHWLGWHVQSDHIHESEAAQVTYYFRCDAPLDGDWQLFIHGDGPQGQSYRIHADHYPAEGLFSTTDCKPGMIFSDTFELPVPVGFPYDYVDLWTGWYRGNQRLTVVPSPRSDEDNRARGPRIVIQP